MSSATDLFEDPIRFARKGLSLAANHMPSLRFSERRLFLAIVDLLILSGTLSFLALNSPSAFTLSLFSVWMNIQWFLVLWCIWFTLGFISDIYDLTHAAKPVRSLWISGGTALATTGFYLLIPYITPTLPDRRLHIVLFPILTTLGIATWRTIYATIFVKSAFRQRAIVIGAGDSGGALAKAVAFSQEEGGQSGDGLGYEIVGFIDDDPGKQNHRLAGISVIGRTETLLSLVQDKKPHEIVLAITDAQTICPTLFEAILDCREMGIPITTMASLYERMTGRVPIHYAGRNLHVVLPVTQPVGHRLYLLLRRMADLLVALLGVMALCLLIPIVWGANWLTSSSGDLFFYQERVGEAGKPFNVIKFRSMMMNAEELTGAVWATEDDPRITSVGRILRRMRLDEVPQFLNVLKGEMSLIGPRPERPSFVAQLTRDIPFYRLRHAVKPGITGWAQTMYRYGASTEDSRIKLEYDLYYIKHQSLYLDLQIILRTIQVMLGFKGR